MEKVFLGKRRQAEQLTKRFLLVSLTRYDSSNGRAEGVAENDEYIFMVSGQSLRQFDGSDGFATARTAP
ncbi:hypothetical protein D3C75_1332880 [compost metagenome]